MRRRGGLFEQIVSFANLWHAWRDFQHGKRAADRTLLALRRDLVAGSYRPAGYRLALLREPKRRLIAAAPVRDRVVHHAVHRVLAPVLDRRLVSTTYACLPGRGSHRAVLAFVAGLRRHGFVLMLDVRRYFLSIDHEILLRLMRERLREADLLELLNVIVTSGAGLYQEPGVAELLGLEAGFPPPACGLPIGNLTSQWWGNHYLDGLDHYVKRQLRIPVYQRYMDDFALFADSQSRLEEAREAIAAWLSAERRLGSSRRRRRRSGERREAFSIWATGCHAEVSSLRRGCWSG